MTRSRKGSFWLSALCLIALMTGFAGLGYGIGRYVIGERYIKRGAVAIRYRQRPQPEARRGFVPPPSPSGAWESRAERSASDEGWLPESQGGARATIEEVPVEVSSGSGEAEATGQPSPEVEPRPSHPQRYTIQVGVFLDERNSQALIDDLHNRGYSARVERIGDSQGTLYRVVTGDFPNERTAERIAQRLMNEGYTGAFVTTATEGGEGSDESTSGHSESR